MIKKIIPVILIMGFYVLTGNMTSRVDGAYGYSGYVNMVLGKVYIKAPGKSAKPAKVGDAVKEGTKIISKGKKSLVDIYFGLRAVRVYGNTQVTVTKLAAGKGDGDTELFLKRGKLFSNITKKLAKSESYSVKTPTTLAGVRGTEFLVEEGSKKSGISCLDGKVAVKEKTRGKEIIVKKAEEATVKEGKDPVKNVIEASRLEQLKILTSISKIREDILNKFGDQKDEMKKTFSGNKAKDQQMLENSTERFNKLFDNMNKK